MFGGNQASVAHETRQTLTGRQASRAGLSRQCDQALDERSNILCFGQRRGNLPVLEQTLGQTAPKRQSVLRSASQFAVVFAVSHDGLIYFLEPGFDPTHTIGA